MAEIHAIVDGAWNAANTWDSNSIPTSDDIVYIDNHVITWSGNIATFKELHFTGSGYIGSTSFQGIGDVFLDLGLSNTQTVFRWENSYYHDKNIITGNIYLYSGLLTNSGDLIVNGNIFAYNSSVILSVYSGGLYGFVTINGNVDIHDASVFKQNTSHRNITVNGVIQIHDDYYVDTPTFYWLSQSWNGYFAKIVNTTQTPFMNNIGQQSNQYVTQIGEIYSPNTNLISEYLPNNRQLIIGKATVKNISSGTSYSWQIDDITFTDSNNLLFDNIYINQVQSNPAAHLHIYTSEQTTDLQPQESNVKEGVIYDGGNRTGTYTPNFPQEANVLKDVEYGDNQKGTLEVIALSGATATADNISVVNLTEQEVNRVKNCATVSTVQKCFEDFKEE